MAASVQRVLILAAVPTAVLTCYLAATTVSAQAPQAPKAQPSTATAPAPQSAAATRAAESLAAAQTALEQPANMDPERKKIWNSPNMMRARLWLYDRIRTSAKITPEDGRKYVTTLENLTPDEMKLWMLQVEQQQEQREQQQAFWQQQQNALAQQAAAEHRATQQAYQNFNQEETDSANQEQAQLNVQAAEQAGGRMYGPNPYSPYGNGIYSGFGGIHYHYHMYPYGY